ncbi:MULTISPECIES: hypothetical protein [unclassified Caulobacter]|uniref:hypothetical protein n=1 Tax=unclassified Caulobacter TaxID=2648921 RepID=UPI000D739503|nr:MULTISPECIES: hypothetical protein [unclassified Caulobacter]
MTIKTKAILVAATCGLLAAAQPAAAYDWGIPGAKVIGIEATYMPSTVVFKIDRAAGACAAGALLFYSPQGDTEDRRIANANAIMSMLMTAKVAGQTLTVTGNNANCTVLFLTME